MDRVNLQATVTSSLLVEVGLSWELLLVVQDFCGFFGGIAKHSEV